MTLLIINSFLGVFFLMFSVIRVLGQSYVVAAGEFAVCIILAINIFILYKGRYTVSSIVSIIIFIMAAFVIFMIQEHNEVDDIYKFSTYMIGIICTAPLMSYALWQMILIAVSGFVGQILIFIFMLMPIAAANERPVPWDR